MKTLTFADLFCGCGGLSHGFAHHPSYRGLLALDNWEQASRVYRANFPRIPFVLRDLQQRAEVTRTIADLAGRCDILLGGPPCQGFSTLGKRRDADPRSRLVETFLEIAKSVQPKVIIIENVRGITSKRHKSGLTFPELVEERLNSDAARGSYHLKAILLDAVEFGLAQTRVRWILVGVRSDIDASTTVLERLRELILAQRASERPTLHDVIGDLPQLFAGQGSEVLEEVVAGRKRTVFNHQALKHSAKLQQAFAHVPIGGGLPNVPRHLLTAHLRRMLDGKYGNGGHIKNIYGRLDWTKPCGTVVAGIDKITCGRFVHPEANRLLSPRECARLQSFPDDFRFFGSLVTQYYLIGNAVPPRFASVLANAIAIALSAPKATPQRKPVMIRSA